MTTAIEPATATLPECRRPTCHNLVAVGKNGEPLKDCETHRDKRPSAKARKATIVETLLTTGEEVPDDQFGDPASERAAAPFGKPSPAPKPGRTSPKQRQDAALKARLAATPAKPGKVTPAAAEKVVTNPALGDVGPHGAPADEPKVHTRFHSGSGKYLAEAKVGGKSIYRYGVDAEAAERKMREHLATL